MSCCCLFKRDQDFRTAVERLFNAVACFNSWVGFTESFSNDQLCWDTVRDKAIPHSSGTGLRQPVIVVVRTGCIGVALYDDPDHLFVFVLRSDLLKPFLELLP